ASQTNTSTVVLLVKRPCHSLNTRGGHRNTPGVWVIYFSLAPNVAQSDNKLPANSRNYARNSRTISARITLVLACFLALDCLLDFSFSRSPSLRYEIRSPHAVCQFVSASVATRAGVGER